MDHATITSGTGARRALAEQLFAANYPKLASWIRRLVDDDETAHEIASEAFVRLLSKWTSPDKLDNPQSYLYMIATNLVRDHWRKTERERRAMRSVSASADREPLSDPAPDVDMRELIQALPARLRDPSCCTTSRPGCARSRSCSSVLMAPSRLIYALPGHS